MPDPAPLLVSTRSGKVRVRAEGEHELSVEGGSIERRDDGALQIRRLPSASTIEVLCAAGTDLTVGTVSGKVDLEGPLGAVRVATSSGTITVESATRLDIRTSSGRVHVATCSGECRVMTKSAGVEIASARRATVAAISGAVMLGSVGAAEVKTVSGKVLIGTTGGERVAVHTVSGKVAVRLPALARPSTRLRSLSGRIRCDIPNGDDFEVAIKTISGTIDVSSG